MLEQLKGPGRMVASSETNGHLIAVLRYADDSWSVSRDNFVLGVWENEQQAECFRLFFQLVNLDMPAGDREMILKIQNLAVATALSAGRPIIN